MLGPCCPWHAFCSCNAKSVSFITKPKFCWCQGVLVASTLPLSCCLCGLYLCGFVFSFPKLFCTCVLCYVINHWDREVFSWGTADLTFSSCRGDALEWMLGDRQSWLGSSVPGQGGGSGVAADELPCPAHSWEGGSSPATTQVWLQLLFCHSSWEELIETGKPRNSGAKLWGWESHILSSV